MPAIELSRPINVRLPVPVHEFLEELARRESIPVSTLVRQAVMRQFPLPANGTNSTTEGTSRTAEKPRTASTSQDRPEVQAEADTAQPASRGGKRRVA